MAFTVLVGLGLDYDVFLLSRIVEYRKKGLNTKNAIIEGLWRTGPIITSAGKNDCAWYSSTLLLSEFCGVQ